jgi:septal ring factor EnvC (AmiA/AmiB activator)
VKPKQSAEPEPEFTEEQLKEAEAEEAAQEEASRKDEAQEEAAPRARKAPERFENLPPSPKKQKQKEGSKEVKPEVKPEVKAEPDGGEAINPRTGKPYVRGGPYHKGGPGSRSSGANPPTAKPKGDLTGALVIDLTKEHKQTVEGLNDTIAKLHSEISKLTAQLSESKAMIKMMKSNNSDAIGFAHAKGLLQQSQEAQSMFQQGLTAGMKMAKGEIPDFPSFTPKAQALEFSAGPSCSMPMSRLSEAGEDEDSQDS